MAIGARGGNPARSIRCPSELVLSSRFRMEGLRLSTDQCQGGRGRQAIAAWTMAIAGGVVGVAIWDPRSNFAATSTATSWTQMRGNCGGEVGVPELVLIARFA